MPDGVVVGKDGRARCFWAARDPDYVAYHDREWGYPVREDRRLFEKICLEGFQAGLAWITILRKREAFRRAFAGFEIAEVARFDARRVTRLLANPGIVRHRGKIESAIHNAKRTLELIDAEGSLASFLWRFEPGGDERPRRMTRAALLKLTQTPSSRAMSRELRRRGFRYVGPTTLYALMQSVGIVNDHLEGCHVRPRALAARKVFRPPR